MMGGMEMSDTPAVSVQTIIKAEPERVYEIVVDLDAMASFGTEFQGGEWVSGRPGELGSAFVGRQRLGDSEWETTSTITTAKPGEQLAWVVGNTDNITATWTVTMRAVPGGTEVSYDFVHGPGPSGLRDRIDRHPESESKFIEGRLEGLQANMIKTLEGIRRRTAR